MGEGIVPLYRQNRVLAMRDPYLVGVGSGSLEGPGGGYVHARDQFRGLTGPGGNRVRIWVCFSPPMNGFCH